MVVRLFTILVVAFMLSVTLPLGSTAQEDVAWDQQRVTELAAQLHEGVKGLRRDTRSIPQDAGTGQSRAYYRLVDNLRLIERETRYLHRVLESGDDRDSTLPTYARIAMLRRDCAEEMERLFVGSPALEKIVQAREIVKQMDSYYGFDPERDDHQRVVRP